MNPEVIAQDARLEQAAEESGVKLAEHRWHWTLDESNPDRVSIREYARQVGRDEAAIRRMGNGYAAWAADGAVRSDFADYLARARLSGDTLAATEAVADARGISIESARRHHADEVREVKASAVERVERNGTSFADEVATVATQRAKARAADKARDAERRADHTLRYLDFDSRIAKATETLKSVLDESAGVEFDSEERELLADSLGKHSALVGLLKMRLVGTVDIDWDAEMAKLSTGSAE